MWQFNLFAIFVLLTLFVSRTFSVLFPRRLFFENVFASTSGLLVSTHINQTYSGKTLSQSFLVTLDTFNDKFEHYLYTNDTQPASEWIQSILTSPDSQAMDQDVVMLARTGQMLLDYENNTKEAFKAAYDVLPFLQSTLGALDEQSREYGIVAFMLAQCFVESLGTKANASEAFRLMAIAAERNLVLAQAHLATYYTEGFGVSADQEKAFQWFTRAAEQGDADACFVLAQKVSDGNYTEESLRWLRTASDLGQLDAQASLGAFYVFDYSNDSYRAEGLELLKIAANRGDADAQFYLGLCLLTGEVELPDAAQAVKWLSRAAAQGQANAEAFVGSMYLLGNEKAGVEVDVDQAVHWLRRAAEKGIASAQAHLGECYLCGLGVEINQTEGVRLIQLAASDNATTAGANDYAGGVASLLGVCYRDGMGVPKDEQEACRLFRVAAETYNNTAGQRNLADCYILGCGVDKDIQEAMKWYRVAAMQGDANAQNSLGMLLCKYPELNQTEKAETWFELAATQGLPIAMQNLGFMYFGEKNYTPAVRWLKKASEENQPKALFALSVCYEMGLGVVSDPLEAFNCLQRAASLNETDAQFKLGEWYYDGNEVVQPNFQLAFSWYLKAARQNHSGAEYCVGMCCFHGHGTKQNYTTAVRYFRRAANHSEGASADGQYMLGHCLHEGLGVPRDLQAAFQWFIKSANAGQMEAQYSLGVCYRDGLGTGKDLVKARYWMREAADLGHNLARKEVHRLGK